MAKIIEQPSGTTDPGDEDHIQPPPPPETAQFNERSSNHAALASILSEGK
jgi:hypothetical protein